MKYLVLLLIVFAGIWWIRQQRQTNHTHSQKSRSASHAVTMVPCTHCGTHVPETDTLRGKQGLYCSESHRQSHEGDA
jgi:uncharacterized protein